MNEVFRPRDIFDTALHYWWFIPLVMLCGAAAGGIISLFRPPIYESQALLSVSIDYVQTGRLTELEEDKALEIVGDIIYSDRVLNQVIMDAHVKGINIDLSNLRQICFRERKGHAWLLRVRHPDPNTATQITNIWLNKAYDTLNDALRRAVSAEILKRPLDLLQNCFEAVAAEPAQAYCNSRNIAAIQAEMQKSAAQYTTEKQASLGLSSALSFAISQTATPLQNPALYARNLSVLAGCLAGLILSIPCLSLISRHKQAWVAHLV